MKKFQTIISSLLVFSSISTALIPTTSFIIQTGAYKERISGSNNVDDYVYSGYLLRYFIYKSSNISENETVEKLEENIINNKAIIYPTINNTNVTSQNVNVFETALMASIVNISIYGMTSWKEFFAEAYSKWITTPDAMKNKSWEILNNFFVDIYPHLQSKVFGARPQTLQESLKYINEYFTNSTLSTHPAVYNTKLDIKPTDAVNLQYQSPGFGTKFGLQQAIPNVPDFWQMSYTYNALSVSLLMWQTKAANDVENDVIKFDGNILQNYIINFNGNDLSAGLANMMNDSYTKASQTSLQKYEDFVKQATQSHYSSFDKLDSELKNVTKYETLDYQTGSTIFLKDSVTAMQNYYEWKDSTVNTFKQQLLNLFNITYTITGNNFKYFLAGFLFSPNAPLIGQKGETAAYTAYNFKRDKNTSQILSTSEAFIVFSAKGFNNYVKYGISQEYQMGWWSSPNIFCTLDHEMGHAVDIYYGMIESARNDAPSKFSKILNSSGIRGEYRGNVFGYDSIVNYNKKASAMKMALLIIFGVFCASIIIAIIWSAVRRKTIRKKTE
ncbi:hypothetical protein [Spiroplasma sp. SV19]|uniref:hypothetical protein n=1 Tax=Spiroplasma sp. SV19 TaxID=2570468 RepID=UPI0024B71AF4|nr:hypothetical protein [Spiroplasma sp. SV19]WHQ37341.1 hypothetical protein E7Y35_05665 [Spiroplasma sp. SV19]